MWEGEARAELSVTEVRQEPHPPYNGTSALPFSLVHHRPEYRRVRLSKSVGGCIELGLNQDGPLVGSRGRGRDGHSLARLQSQLFPACNQRLSRHYWVGGQLNINDSFISRFERPQRFTEKIEGRNGVPGGTDSAQEFFRPVAVPNDFEVPGSVVREAR